MRHVAHGTLRLSNTGGRAVVPLHQRLLLIHEGLKEVIQEFRPAVMAIERVFFAKNAVSALKLGQARGAAILCGAIHGLEIIEYSPSEVKQALVGFGGADKVQVAEMVRLLLGNLQFKTLDASDGLALAICHAHTLSYGMRISAESRKSSRRASLAESLGASARAQIERKLRGE